MNPDPNSEKDSCNEWASEKRQVKKNDKWLSTYSPKPQGNPLPLVRYQKEYPQPQVYPYPAETSLVPVPANYFPPQNPSWWVTPVYGNVYPYYPPKITFHPHMPAYNGNPVHPSVWNMNHVDRSQIPRDRYCCMNNGYQPNVCESKLVVPAWSNHHLTIPRNRFIMSAPWEKALEEKTKNYFTKHRFKPFPNRSKYKILNKINESYNTSQPNLALKKSGGSMAESVDIPDRQKVIRFDLEPQVHHLLSNEHFEERECDNKFRRPKLRHPCEYPKGCYCKNWSCYH